MLSKEEREKRDRERLTPFRMKALAACAAIPRGRVASYGDIARRIGSCARAIGGAMRHNPLAPTVPCHRIVAASGEIGGFSGVWDAAAPSCLRKRDILTKEGVRFDAKGRIAEASFLSPEEDLDMEEGRRILHECLREHPELPRCA